MTLTAGQLAPLAASAKTEIDRVIALPLGTATLQELLYAKQAGYDMGIATYDGLDAHIQYHVDNSASLSIDDLQRLRFITMPARIRAIHEDNPLQFNLSQTIIVPDDCWLLKITFQAAGGPSGTSQYSTSNQSLSGGGGGGGAAVVDFEMAVSPGQELPLTVGNTLVLGLLTVGAGGAGGNYNGTKLGGDGGKVLVNGAVFDDGVTAIAGSNGGTGTKHDTYLSGVYGITSNFKESGSGGGKDSIGGGYRYRGAGGGASATSDGLGGGSNETRPSGTGGPSPHSLYGANTDIASRSGGARSPYVIINFVKQPA